VQTFLRDCKVNPVMAISAVKQVRERLRSRKQLALTDVPAMELLLGSLRTELRRVIFRGHLVTCPFLRVCDYVDQLSFSALCRDTVDFFTISLGDHLVEAGTSCIEAYVTV